MDDFVRDKLKEWGLSEWENNFKDEGIDEESFYLLGDQDINDLFPKKGPRLKFKAKFGLLKPHEEAAASTELPSTSDKGKRKMDRQMESNEVHTPHKRQCDNETRASSEAIILSEVKAKIGVVLDKLRSQNNTKLGAFVESKVLDLETKKREIVGVFGKTGAGKSSLINAVIGQKNLLPSGSVNACTSVMIKVEGNMHTPKYEAEIEFITTEEWKDELWPISQSVGDHEDQDPEDETVQKLSAVYGDEWNKKPPESLMDKKYFTEIPEFLYSKRKNLTYDSPKDLSSELKKYTRNETNQGEDTGDTRWYWPLVKCVTLKVPHNHLLQHVTLVDLPGNGDRNKSRDQMWKGVIGNCSTVWIVAEINRAASEKEPWEILESSCHLLGNGGECQRIHFICTKSDIEDDHSTDVPDIDILKRNANVKKELKKEFNRHQEIKKHFSDKCFKVFTVSSREFFKRKLLKEEDTEIPKLQEFLEMLNECHSETLNYVSGAYGLLSLIQGASLGEAVAEKTKVCEDLGRNLYLQLDSIKKEMEETYNAFEKCLTEGVENSKNSCERTLDSFLHPRRKSGRGFHKTLKCLVNNSGIHPRKQLNLNLKLALKLTNSIDETFKNTFPNDGESAPFNSVIREFSLETEKLIQNYKDVELQLIFLKREEEQIKTKLNKVIREDKKTIYRSLIETIEENMQEGYNKAAEFTGKDSLLNMREKIKEHVHDAMNNMFDRAKDVMLNKLKDLMESVWKTLEDNMKESIHCSLLMEDHSIPDVSEELETVQEFYNKLKTSSNMKKCTEARRQESMKITIPDT
ncbi:nuclear GTPase SLIP-GC-like isoform X2 [Cololabis saira]|uniref:nuclear GTPase SLIP-GC-like isoform X2 n=1 Tax=Cololabis saira TaxID=129043 RepID=UPI002AD3AEAF|nr:nuclear GTPase SLIP-GC-like isoform X2 [Cololabis saira]